MTLAYFIFLIFMPIAAALWGIGNGTNHKITRERVNFEDKSSPYFLEQGNEWRQIAHKFWWITMFVYSVMFYFLISSSTKEYLLNLPMFAYSAACYWGVFGRIAKLILTGKVLYFSENEIDKKIQKKLDQKTIFITQILLFLTSLIYLIIQWFIL